MYDPKLIPFLVTFLFCPNYLISGNQHHLEISSELRKRVRNTRKVSRLKRGG